jgi:superkiller protein 3
MGERDQAADTYAAIVELDPDDAEAWEHLGTWRSLQGDSEAAIHAYARSVELDSSRITARFSLAEAYLETDRYDEALAVYQGLVEGNELLQDDDLAAAYAGLAETYNSLGRYDEAVGTAKLLLERFAEDPEGYYQLATAYDGLGRFDEAIENYQNAIDNDPLNADYYNDLADTFRKAKRYGDALEYAQQAIAMDPSLIVAYETLAQTYQAMGRPEDAQLTLAQAEELRAASLEENEEES